MLRLNSIIRDRLSLASALASVILVCTLSLSCSDDEAPPTCPPGFSYELADGSCVGVTTQHICQGSYCKDAKIQCAKTYHVSSAAASSGDGSTSAPFQKLADAAMVATSGDCVLVASGSYAGASFKGGVSLLGVGADASIIKGSTKAAAVLEIKGGTGGVIRGFRIEGPGEGLSIQGTQNLKVEQVYISGATGASLYAGQADNLTLINVTTSGTTKGLIGKDTTPRAIGLVLTNGSSAKVTGLLAQKNGQIGHYSMDSVVTMSSSALVDNGVATDEASRGLHMGCSSVASCKALGQNSITGVLLRNNYLVSLSIVGVQVTLSNTTVNGTKHAIDSRTTYRYSNAVQILAYRPFKQGFPVPPGQYHSAKVTMNGCTVDNSEGAGVVVEFSSAVLKNNTISDNGDRGIWLQHIAGSTGQSVLLEGNKVEANTIVAIGGSRATNVTIKGGTASHTRTKRLLSMQSEEFPGDGIMAAMDSKFTVEAVSLVKNGRVSVVYDASSGSVANCKIDRKDLKLDDGILAQNNSQVSVKGNQDTKGVTLSAVTSLAQKVGLDDDDIPIPPSMAAPKF